MKISELIKELEKFKKEEGDIRVVIFNDTIAEMIWNKEQYNEEDAWEDIIPCIEYTQDNMGNEVEKVICIERSDV